MSEKLSNTPIPGAELSRREFFEKIRDWTTGAAGLVLAGGCGAAAIEEPRTSNSAKLYNSLTQKAQEPETVDIDDASEWMNKTEVFEQDGYYYSVEKCHVARPGDFDTAFTEAKDAAIRRIGEYVYPDAAKSVRNNVLEITPGMRFEGTDPIVIKDTVDFDLKEIPTSVVGSHYEDNGRKKGLGDLYVLVRAKKEDFKL